MDGEFNSLCRRPVQLQHLVQVSIHLWPAQQPRTQQGFGNVFAPLPVLSQASPQACEVSGKPAWQALPEQQQSRSAGLHMKAAGAHTASVREAAWGAAAVSCMIVLLQAKVTNIVLQETSGDKQERFLECFRVPQRGRG